MSARVLAVWCPDWPAVAAAQEAGLGPERPVAVVGRTGVVACTAAARAAGVRRGIRRREAQFRCPELAVLAPDDSRDATLFEPVVRALDAVVPGIELLRPGLVVCSAAGALRYHGGVEPVVTGVLDAVAAAGVECRVGLADELPTAVLAAREGRCLEHGRDAAYLAPLPVEALSWEPALGTPEPLAELTALLRRLGVHTLGAFAELEARHVTTRFGEHAAVAHRLARAVPWRPPSVSALPEGLAVVHRCDPPVDRVDAAAFLGRRLAVELHRGLAAAGVSCLRLVIRACFDDGRRVERVWRCTEPLTPEGTAERLRWQLDGWLTGSALAGEPGAVVVEMELDPLEVAPAGTVQEGLWGSLGFGQERARRAVLRVQEMLGPDAVRVPVVTGGRGPGERVRSIPHGEHPADPVSRGPWPGTLPVPAPSVVWPGASYRVELRSRGRGCERLPVTGGVSLLCGAGSAVGVDLRGMLTGSPAWMEVAGRHRAVEGWSRPWPVDEAWWGGAAAGGVPVSGGAAPVATGSVAGRGRVARLQVSADGVPALLLCCVMGRPPGRWVVEGVYE